MLAQSDLVAWLSAMRNRLGVLICIYGDLACPISDVLLRPAKANNFTSHVSEYATRTSHYSEFVEWVFEKMGELWHFVTHVRQTTTGSCAMSKEDCVNALLTKYHTCRYVLWLPPKAS